MNNTRNKAVIFTLRIAVAMCFIGHGAFGIITKEIWCNYFGVFGIGKSMAYSLMPVVGIADILFGIAMLVYPARAIPAWLVVWGMVTAMLRPLSGEPFAEFMERAGNYGAPLALLVFTATSGAQKWLKPVTSGMEIDNKQRLRAAMVLRVVVCLLLLGHGWLNIIEKASLLKQYQSLGFSNPIQAAHIIGVLEIVAALIILIRPSRSLLLLFFIWKMVSELWYPNWELFEWIERGGSYGSILALWFIVNKQTAVNLLAIVLKRVKPKLAFTAFF